MNNLRNRVQLIGHLGMNPEIKTLEKGSKLAKFSLATNDSYKNAQGEKVTETEWHNIVAWNKTAKIAADYLSKGKEIALEGKLINQSYQDKEGNTKYISQIIANQFMILGKKKVD